MFYIGDMTVRTKRRQDKPVLYQRTKEHTTPILVVPAQRHDLIERRRDIRETFHDSRARTIKSSRS
jgi:hypothetical protein